MSFVQELREDTAEVLNAPWSCRDGRTVPKLESVTLADNDAIEIDGTVLYADMVGSSKIVSECAPTEAAAAYKAYLIDLRVANETTGPL